MPRKNAVNDLIVVMYLPAKGLTQANVYSMARDASETIKRTVPEARVIAIPDPNRETGKVECINPKLVSKKEWESVEQKVLEMEAIMEDLLEITKPEKPELPKIDEEIIFPNES